MDDARFGPDRRVTLPDPLPLDGGGALAPVTVAYETLGTPDAARSNVVLVCHALTGDQHVAHLNPRTGRPGWWERMVGPGRPIDTDRWCVVCANVIGGCSGSTGPSSERPDGTRWDTELPVLTIPDMARAHLALLDHLGIARLHAVVGGSMGGMQSLALASAAPERTAACVCVASAARHSAQNIAFHEVGRQAIMADPKWRGGRYDPADPPAKGLAVARMAAHITYLSERGLTEKFGRRLQDREAAGFGFDADFQVESYLRHQGLAFTGRFDANSYLTITRAMDYWDLGEAHGGVLARAFDPGTRFCVVSFDSDWLYPTAESRGIVAALNAAGAPASFVELSSPFGHDAFLLDTPGLDRIVAGFLTA